MTEKEIEAFVKAQFADIEVLYKASRTTNPDWTWETCAVLRILSLIAPILHEQ